MKNSTPSIQTVNNILELLKHQGLSAKTYQLTKGLLTALTEVEVKKVLDEWLTQQMAIQRRLGSVEDIPLEGQQRHHRIAVW